MMGARPSAFAKPPVEVKPERVWSEPQQAIFDWFRYEPLSRKHDAPAGTPPMNLVVRARAGTGKTTTIIEGVNRAPESSILLCAFNKRIADELNSRLDNPNAEAKTLHALGYQMVRRQWPGMPVNQRFERSESLTDRALKGYEADTRQKTPFQIRRLVTTLHTKAREMTPLDPTESDLTRLAFQFDLTPDEGWGAYDLDFVVTHALMACHDAASEPPTRDIGIDYADMIYLPLAWNLTAKDYQLVVVDEAQDMTMGQLEIAERMCSGRICVVGDDRQCQPAGTMVRSSVDGNVPIESLKVGDTIEAFDRHGQVFVKTGKVNQIEARHYSGELINVTAGSRVTRCTPNHKWLVRWTDKSERAWITYLMRKGGRFRIGMCQMFRQFCTNFGLSERARVERAESAWVLQVHDSFAQAIAYEQILSARYGLPEMVFMPPSNIKHFTAEVIEQVYFALDTDGMYDRAVKCLNDHDRDICYPLYTRANEYERRGRTTLFETQACNLLSGYMSVAVAPDIISGHDKKDRKAVTWAPIALWREDFEGLVYSLDIDKYHKYVADGLVTCNSIYSFRGADSGAIDRLKAKLGALELPLKTTYRCGTEIVKHAQRLVPDIAAGPDNPPGLIDECTDDQLLSLVQPGDFVLSRLNAPLVCITLRLLRRGVRATMSGRDIGAGVLAILKKLKVVEFTPLTEVITRIETWERKTLTKLAVHGQADMQDRVRDQAAVLYAFAEDADSTKEMLRKLDNLFTEPDSAGDREQVILSSVHKIKGLESSRAFILCDTFYRRGRSIEEDNTVYVACTRPKHHLTFVNPPLLGMYP